MKNSILSIAILATAALFTSCKKDGNDNQNQHEKAAAFIARNAIPVQSFTGNATTGFTITGNKGTKITVPAGGLKDAAGNIITGNVTITLKEVLSKKDVMFSGKMTESNGQLLVSGGELEIKAKQGANDLLVVDTLGAKAIVVVVPNVMKGGDMNLFVNGVRQNPNGGGSAGGGQQQNPETWIPAPYAPFGNGPNSYTFNLPGFTWVNCDRFYSDPNPKTTITALPDFQDDNVVTDLQVMLVFKNINTVITLPFNYSLQKFESYGNSLPIGLQADLVIIGKDSSGDLQFGTQAITISANMHINAPIQKTTQQTVDAYLASVN